MLQNKNNYVRFLHYEIILEMDYQLYNRQQTELIISMIKENKNMNVFVAFLYFMNLNSQDRFQYTDVMIILTPLLGVPVIIYKVLYTKEIFRLNLVLGNKL
jgi:hypothetical protein